MSLGYDINGRPIRLVKETSCERCGEVIGSFYSDGTDIRSSCKCLQKNKAYLVVLSFSLNNELFVFASYEEAYKKYKSSAEKGIRVFLSELVQTNL